MADDLYLGDRTIMDGESVYLNDDLTMRLYNDSGVLRVQIKAGGSWVNQESLGE